MGRTAQFGKGNCRRANPRGVNQVVDSWPRDKAWSLPTVIDNPTDFPIAIKVAAPEKVGIDRLLNGVAANRLCRGSLAAIIVSSGTATTVDYVDSSGAFAGCDFARVRTIRAGTASIHRAIAADHDGGVGDRC